MKNLWRALACESPGESLFLGIYRSFSFSKVSKSNCYLQRQRSTASTTFQQKVKKVQTLESISREQDVISSLATYYISHALPSHWRTGGIFQSKATLRNQVLKHMTKKQVFDLFLKGANNSILCVQPKVYLHRVNEEECFLFLVM